MFQDLGSSQFPTGESLHTELEPEYVENEQYLEQEEKYGEEEQLRYEEQQQQRYSEAEQRRYIEEEATIRQEQAAEQYQVALR